MLFWIVTLCQVDLSVLQENAAFVLKVVLKIAIFLLIHIRLHLLSPCWSLQLASMTHQYPLQHSGRRQCVAANRRYPPAKLHGVRATVGTSVIILRNSTLSCQFLCSNVSAACSMHIASYSFSFISVLVLIDGIKVSSHFSISTIFPFQFLGWFFLIDVF